ncbi:hypothetical protein BH20ACI2_BH20ACI2_22480 [soil metagenome]
MKKLILNVAAIFLLGSFVSNAAAQEIKLKRVPRNISVEELKKHEIAPANIRDIRIEEVKPNVRRIYKFEGKVIREKFKAKPKLDVNQFGELLHFALKSQVAGYVLHVRQNGNKIYELKWDFAQTPANTNVGWNENARMHVASVSKYLTAVGLVKALDSKGISYDAKIINYLPDYWAKGNNIDKITFRHLMTHKAGFNYECCASDYNFMKSKVAGGVAAVGGNGHYHNMNFGLMRILIPIINGDVDKDAKFPPLNDIIWDGLTIGLYKDYMQDNVFKPAGVQNAGFAPVTFPSGAVIKDALAYKYPTLHSQKGWNSGDLKSMSGGAAWRLSIKELLDVMNHVRRKNTILPAAKAQMMLDNNFGIDWNGDTEAGKFYTKNGGWGNGAGQTEQTVMFYFPDNIEVAVFVNSPIGAQNFFLSSMVSDAYKVALKD